MRHSPDDGLSAYVVLERPEARDLKAHSQGHPVEQVEHLDRQVPGGDEDVDDVRVS